jgi:hypothetical protein
MGEEERKKEEMRKNEEERGRQPMYNTRAPGSLVLTKLTMHMIELSMKISN